MKKLLISTVLVALWSTAFAATLSMPATAFAAKLGVSIVNFDNNFQTLLMHGMQDRAKEKGVDIQVEDAQNDVAKQLDQVKNFIASGVDAIIVTLVDTNASKTISEEAAKAGIPLVFVNLEPVDMAKLPEKQVYVGSNEVESGTLEAFEVCKMLRAKGRSAGATAYIVMGSLVHQAALQRTKDVEQVFSTDMCSFIKVTDKQSSEWSRDNAQNLMTNWLTAGPAPDAVIANNDESAIGAILALKANGVDMKNVVVGGIDATQDGLQAMKAGELSVTVFQNAKGQGGGGVDAALALAKGEKVDRVVYVPFELVTPANAAEYLGKN
ncbi:MULTISPECIES: sugar ABC transporter substrate-binding protein [unclassified Mesorhizobium]|uniref:sugar ABC transporter substrate-binding protein n=1 Tax=unclassified Mesorhizobium TaxID=325217 RepID=UPI000FCBEE72|nr:MULTISPECIES: sugar ABC transporter substrate-binding protein [unclassified Mesorhizobium]TGP20253.1 sugar ABC transporter substrate-binding protein [Mesorhizobium sp. M1D.F.Ca.ET.231.01.1.1]TGP27730.1 sugar ABC transporter substrate-binding protein [Mesorhizobium sp. M1D.F.Ca.ET.234.01.1.1]TGS42080.1 sugar ABC transporter substrate-binding protein [Mesorhizobium sp. M1D.F.Ca.ET.184.01.1.1]TGS59432.1 sugar ABC transporter substrate-binding protein [Mesorhizobium sp. M1D.F.Ca.ET.183.01.1.1]